MRLSPQGRFCRAAVLFALSAVPAAAQPAYRLKDLNPGVFPSSSNPGYFIDYDGVALFTAVTAQGRELWRSDGTPDGTYLVKDLLPGGDSDARSLVRCGAYVCFSAKHPTMGIELWRTDGTEAGTVVVRDINPGTGWSSPGNFRATPFGTFFNASDGATGVELWKTDGTEAGTVLVKDIRPGSASSVATPLGVVGPTLYFLANDGVTGKDLWKTDGTETSTVKVKDLAGTGDPFVTGGFAELNGKGYFGASADSAGSEVWVTDGTAAGTVRLADINPSGQANPSGFTAFLGAVYFAATDGASGSELWRTDGVTTTRVRDILPGTGSSSPSGFFAWNGRLFFTANDGAHGAEIWTTQGTAATTTLFADIWPGSGSAGGFWFTAAGPFLFFTANGFANDTELWMTSGSGVVRVADIRPGSTGSNPHDLLYAGGHVFLSANDGVHGQELWVSDGPSATAMPRDIYGSALSGNPTALTPAGSSFYFAANHPTAGVELWKSDGTEGGTAMVFDANAGSGSTSPAQITPFDGNVVFVPTGMADVEPWRSDGTAAGTFRVANINPGGSSNPAWFTPSGVAGSVLYFTATTSTNGTELWGMLGPALSAFPVRDIRAGSASSSPHDLVDLGGALLFAANDGVFGDELWRSDGSSATFLLKDISPGPTGSGIGGLTVMNGVAYFAAGTGATGVELWRSDGTPAGTTPVADLRPGPASSQPANFTVVGGTLYFTADDGFAGRELWKTDGTPAGTVMVADVNAGPLGSAPTSLRNVEGRLFFVADDGFHGAEVWTSDGTPAGTALVDDIVPGPGSSSPQGLANVNGSLLFQANDGVAGAELWSSDGTPAGTFMVADVNPGPNSSAPTGIIRVGEQVFFAADDGVSGIELWSIANEPPMANAGPDRTEQVDVVADLDGSLSWDPDLGPFFFEWHDETGAVVGREPHLYVSRPAGTYAYTLVVRDGLGGRSQDEVVLTVTDIVRHILSVSVEGSDGGTGVVSVGALGDACDTVPGLPHICVYPLPEGTVATLVPTPGPGSVFAGWVGACTGTDPCTLTLDGDRAVWGTFRGPQPLTVTVESIESGGGDVGVGATDVCHAQYGAVNTCTFYFPYGTQQGLSAAPDPLSVFLGWDGACTGEQPCGVTMDGPQAVTARFRGPQPLTVTVESIESGGGDVTFGPSDVCHAQYGAAHSCTFYRRAGTIESLYQFPDPLSVFAGWDGACIGMSPSCTVVVDNPKTAIVRFRGPQPLTVTVESIESGGGDVSMGPFDVCHAQYGASHSCTVYRRIGTQEGLYAAPDPLSVFLGWDGACTGTGPCMVTVNDPTLVVARFRGPQPLTVTVESIESGGGDVWIGPNDVCHAQYGTSHVCTVFRRIGTDETLYAAPDPLSVFLGWDGVCTGALSFCSVTVSNPTPVTARFRGPQPMSAPATPPSP